MRNSKVKYGGIIVAIIGLFMLIFLGYNYAINYYYHIPEIDMSDYTIYAIIGLIMLIGGVLIWIFVDD